MGFLVRARSINSRALSPSRPVANLDHPLPPDDVDKRFDLQCKRIAARMREVIELAIVPTFREQTVEPELVRMRTSRPGAFILITKQSDASRSSVMTQSSPPK